MTFLVSNIVPAIVETQPRRHLDINAVEHRSAYFKPVPIVIFILPAHVQSNFRTIQVVIGGKAGLDRWVRSFVLKIQLFCGKNG